MNWYQKLLDWKYQVLARLAFKMLKPWMVQQYETDGEIVSVMEIMADVIMENTGVSLEDYLEQTERGE